MDNPYQYSSWGNYPLLTPKSVERLSSFSPSLPAGRPLLPYGLGRSYGDVCLTDKGTLLDTRNLDHILAFDEERGIIRTQAGLSFAQLLEIIVPKGWFLPVSPGTKYVTVGGAVANDIHGKNHHVAGTFGCHVRAFELLRSTGERILCTPQENTELFSATIGGLGLTGLILWVEFSLKRIETPWIMTTAKRFRSLDEFFALSQAAKDEEYTVAWLDTTARGKDFGRGVFMVGRHATKLEVGQRTLPRLLQVSVPCRAPSWFLNRWSLRTLNTAYYYAPLHKSKKHVVYYQPFFYPLDAILHWNRVYGKRGFLQYQFVLPPDEASVAVTRVLQRAQKEGLASFVSVLKVCGDLLSPGLLSFPKPGVTLAIDVPFQGTRTLQALTALDALVASYGGRLYPAKDARMSPEMFQASYPRWKELERLRDPAFLSHFWQRVTT